MGILNTLTGDVSFERAVLWTRRDDNYRIMSDVYGVAEFAYVWNGSEITSIMTYCSEGSNFIKVTVDATDAVRRAAFDWKFKKVYESLYEKAVYTLKNTFVVDDIVNVVAGRKAKGRTGRVAHKISSQYRSGYKSTSEHKYLIAFSDEKETKYFEKYKKQLEVYKDCEWVWGRNIKHVSPKIPDDLEIFIAAHNLIKRELPNIGVSSGFEIPALPSHL